MILPMVMSMCASVGNGSCIKCAFMTFWSSNDKSGQCKFIYSSFNMKKEKEKKTNTWYIMIRRAWSENIEQKCEKIFVLNTR